MRTSAVVGKASVKSIQTKFIVLILGCVLLSSAVIGGAGILNAGRVIDEDSGRIMTLMCNERAQEIDALLLRIEQSVDTLAEYSAGQIDDLNRFHDDPSYVDEITEQIRAVALNAANNTEGALAVYVRFNPDIAPSTSGLFWSRTERSGAFKELTPTDISRYSAEDVEHVGWYYLPIENGKPLWMMPYENKNLGVQMISYVIPLYRDGTAIGVVGMDIDFQVIEHIVKEVHVYDTGYAFLVDDNAHILSHKTAPQGSLMADLERGLQPGVDQLAGAAAVNGLVSYSWHGEDKRMALSVLHNGMRLGITAPASEIDAAMNALIFQNVVSFAIIALLSVVLTVLVTRRIVRPLKELDRAAQRIADGDLSITLESKTKDEVGTLTESFRQTVEHLRRYLEYINGLAYRDGLTGLKNKTAYNDAVDRLNEKIRSGKPEFAVVVLDINDLKDVNDTFGHDFGDMLIIDSGKVICEVFEHSPVYRVGGDEFVAILEQRDLANCQQLLTKLERKIEQINAGSRPAGSVSLARGLAVYEEDIDHDFASVFKRADEAMYRNKAAMKAFPACDE